MRLSLSVEETNRLRERLGLRLIPTGTETLVDHRDSPEYRTEDAKKRILHARERAQERAEHIQATTLAPGEEVLSQKTDTSSWLELMREKRQLDVSKSTQTRSFETRSAPPQQAVEANGSDEESQRDAISLSNSRIRDDTSLPLPKQNRSVIKEAPSPTPLDPLEAPAEQAKTDARPPEPSQRALFRPKKRAKTIAKQRQRTTSAIHDQLIPSAEDIKDDEAAYIKFLNDSRTHNIALGSGSRERTSKEGQVYKADSSDLASTSNEDAPGYADEKSQTGDGDLVLGPASLLLTVNTEAAGPKKEDDHARLYGSHHSAEGRVPGTNSPTTTAVSSPPPVKKDETNQEASHGVSDTLHLLRSAKSEPRKRDAPGRGAWARRLATSRMIRETQLKAQEAKFSQLPAHERNEAMDLVKRQIALEEAKEAAAWADAYEPEVELVRRDDNGAIVDEKTAFKQLSRAFHGT